MKKVQKNQNDETGVAIMSFCISLVLVSIAFLVTHFVPICALGFSGQDVNVYDYFNAFCIGSSIICGRLLRERRNRFKDQRKATEAYEI